MSRRGSDLEPIRSEFAFDPTWQSQSGPKTAPKCIQTQPKSHTNRHDHKRNLLFDPTCQSPAFYKTIKICWGNECFLKADLCIPRVTPQWLQSDAKLNQHHLHKPKVTSKSLQNDPKVTPTCPKMTSKWCQSDVKVSYDRRKSFGKMFLICLWADLGPTWGRSEANLHSIRPDKGKRDPKRTPNGPKMVPK